MVKIRKGSDLRKENWGSPSIQDSEIAAKFSKRLSIRTVTSLRDISETPGNNVQSRERRTLDDETVSHEGKQGCHARKVVESDHLTCSRGSPRNGTNKISIKRERVVAKS